MRKFAVLVLAILSLGAIAAAQFEPAPVAAPHNEFFLGYAYLYANTNGISSVSRGDVDVDNTSMNGFAFEFAHYLPSRLGIVIDLAHESNNAVNSTGIKYTKSSYMVGPAYRLKQRGFFTPSIHLMGGVENGTFTSPQNGGELSKYYYGYNAAVAAGVSLDGNLSKHLGVRIAQVDYVYTNHYSSNQSSIRYTGGVVVRF
jgi:hypothetical protein